MPRPIIDTQTSRPRYVRRAVAAGVVLALAVAVVAVLALMVLRVPGK